MARIVLTAAEINEEYWNADCKGWRGRILTGTMAHYCAEWDGLPVDETCDEYESCRCKLGSSKENNGWTGKKCTVCRGHGDDCRSCGGTGEEYDSNLDERLETCFFCQAKHPKNTEHKCTFLERKQNEPQTA